MLTDDSSERKRIKLWVDAICIDQFDSRERIRQVVLMRGIFGSATRVLGWLGEDNIEQYAKRNFLYFCKNVHSRARFGRGHTKRFNTTCLSNSIIARHHAGAPFSVLSQSPDSVAGGFVEEIATSKRESILFCGQSMIAWEYVVRCALLILRECFLSRVKAYAVNSLDIDKADFDENPILCPVHNPSKATSRSYLPWQVL